MKPGPLGAAALSLSLLACGADSVGGEGFGRCQQIRKTAPPGPISLVVIVNDTWRPDRTGIYGGPARTPVFDAFARANLWFTRAATQASWTKPSVATLFTSLYPSQHQILDLPVPGNELIVDVLTDEFHTLAETVRLFGGKTAGFVANGWITEPFGFGQGFEVYEDLSLEPRTSTAALNQAALDWIGKLEPDVPFFLYLHYLESHMPYGDLSPGDLAHDRESLDNGREVPQEGLDYLGQLKMTDGSELLASGVKPSLPLLQLAYDRGVEDFDQALGIVLAGLEKHPAWERMAVIVTSDHGESLFEHGFGNHGVSMYEPEAAIPLAIRLPGSAADDPEIDCPVGLIDVMPTLCDYYGIHCPDGVAGRSFLATSTGDETREQKRYLVTEGTRAAPRHRSIRNERYKLIYEPGGPLIDASVEVAPGPKGIRDGDRGKRRPLSLYDLSSDPLETTDLLEFPDDAARIQALVGVMAPALAGAVDPRERTDERQRIPLDAELVERLKALGYLGGS